MSRHTPTDTASKKIASADYASAKAVSAKTVPLNSTFRQYRLLLIKDLRQEFHTHDMLVSMGIYAILVLVVFGAALTQVSDEFDILQMSGGLIWALIVFTSLLGLNKSFSAEREDGALEGLLLIRLDRSVIFLAKTTSNIVFLAIVEIITLPLFYFFFLSDTQATIDLGLLLAPLALGTVGMAGVGTLLSTIAMNTRGKDVLLAVLFIPVIFPLLYACVSATTAVILQSPELMSYLVPSIALAAGFDVVMICVSWLLYEFVVSV
jgi:heme exporter protein B